MKNDEAKVLLISHSTSLAFQDESMATLHINPCSFSRALVSPPGMAIGLVTSTAGGKQTTFLV